MKIRNSFVHIQSVRTNAIILFFKLSVRWELVPVRCLPLSFPGVNPSYSLLTIIPRGSSIDSRKGGRSVTRWKEDGIGIEAEVMKAMRRSSDSDVILQPSSQPKDTICEWFAVTSE